MAGNVKEWCLERELEGAGATSSAAASASRSTCSSTGRAVAVGSKAELRIPVREALLAAARRPPPRRLEPAFRDYAKEKPVSDEVFRAYKGLYAYDKGELNARVEETETTADWTREKVSFNAAYGGERVIAYLYPAEERVPAVPDRRLLSGLERDLPGQVRRRAQSFIVGLPSQERPGAVFPDLQEHLRAEGRPEGRYAGAHRPSGAITLIMWSKDLGRSLDYLEHAKRRRRHEARLLRVQLGGRDRADPPRGRRTGSRSRSWSRAASEFQKPLPGGRPDQLRDAREDARAAAERPVRLSSFRWSRRSFRFFRLLGTPRRTSARSSTSPATMAALQGLDPREPRLAGQVPRAGEEVAEPRADSTTV